MPEGPTMASISPRSTWRLSPRKTSTGIAALRYVLERSRASRKDIARGLSLVTRDVGLERRAHGLALRRVGLLVSAAQHVRFAFVRWCANRESVGRLRRVVDVKLRPLPARQRAAQVVRRKHL